LKVWILAGHFRKGGLERVLTKIIEILRQNRIDSEVVSRSYEAHPSTPTEKYVDFQKLPSKTLLGFILDVIRGLHNQRPTHVITSANDIACLLIVLKILHFRTTNIIVTQHLTISPPLEQSRGIKRLKLVMIKWAMRHLYPRADGLVAVSRGVADDMAKSLGLNPATITTIYNPIVDEQTTRLLKAPLPTNFPSPTSDESLITFAGRLEPGKRVDLLLKAFANVRQQHRARLLILGTGSLRETLEEQARQLSLGEDAVFLGHLDNILPVLKCSTVLVLASDFEGFGNVLVEAMACGTQVIASDCPSGPAEILDQGRYGQLIAPNSSRSLEDALRKTLSGEFHVPAALLRERAEYFSVERARDAYLQLLNGLQ